MLVSHGRGSSCSVCPVPALCLVCANGSRADGKGVGHLSHLSLEAGVLWLVRCNSGRAVKLRVDQEGSS